MKNLALLIFSVLFMSALFSLGQQKTESILFLKNGYSVKGEIIEKTDKTIKIKMMDGQIFEYPSDQIERVSLANEKTKTSGIANGFKSLASKNSHEPNTIFVKGNQVVNVGLGNNLYKGSTFTAKFPPISASYELGVVNSLFDAKSTLGVGGFLGYTSAKRTYAKYSDFTIGIRSSAHYQFMDKLDTYAGLMLRYRISSTDYVSSHTTDEKTNTFKFSIYTGARYYFTDKFAGFVEIGGKPLFKFGAVMKF